MRRVRTLAAAVVVIAVGGAIFVVVFAVVPTGPLAFRALVCVWNSSSACHVTKVSANAWPIRNPANARRHQCPSAPFGQGTAFLPALDIARPDGSVVQVEFTSTQVEVGEERYVFSVDPDVSERRRLEEQLRQSQKNGRDWPAVGKSRRGSDAPAADVQPTTGDRTQGGAQPKRPTRRHSRRRGLN